MKGSHFIIVFCLGWLCSLTGNAQEQDTLRKKPSAYLLAFGGGPAAKVSYAAGAGIYIMGQNGGGCKIALGFSSFIAKNLPANYTPGLFGNNAPNETITTFSVTWWKHLGKPGLKVRPFIDLGPSMVFYAQRQFFQNPPPPERGLNLRGNYSKEKELKTGVGLEARTGLEIDLATGFQLELAGFSNLNTLASFYGIGLIIKINLSQQQEAPE